MNNKLLILISIVLISGCKKKPSVEETPLTESQKISSAVNKLKTKKFLLSNKTENVGYWNWDSINNQPNLLTSDLHTSSGDTLQLSYDTFNKRIQFGVISAGTADSIFFPKIYKNDINEEFIGFRCMLYPYCNGYHGHTLQNHNHDYDTVTASSFHNYKNFYEPVDEFYNHNPYIEVQYYLDKDSIVIFHVYHDGSVPVDPSQRRGYIFMYGHGIN